MMSPGTYTSALAATPSDTTVLVPTAGLYVGGAGNLTVVMAGDGGTVLFTAVPAGSFLPVSVTKIKATGTAATAIVILR